MKPTHVLYIHSHDTGRWLSPFGFPAAAPNLERFSERATRFTNAFSVAPTCSPSRTGLLSGLYPHEMGMFGLAHRGFSWAGYEGHLVRELKANGYETVLCGVQHVAPERSLIGYDRFLDGPEDYFNHSNLDPVTFDGENARRVAAFVDDGAFSAERGPTFLSFGLLTTHRPYPVHTSSDRTADAPVAPSTEAGAPAPPSNTVGTSVERGGDFIAADDLEAYRQSLLAMDESIGIVLDAIDRAGVWDNTLVLYVTDHGVAFPDMKATLKDAGIGTAMMLSVPPGLLPGPVVSRTDALVSHVDVYPTLRELLQLTGAGQTTPPGQDERGGQTSTIAPNAATMPDVEVSPTHANTPPWRGRSLVPILTGSAGEIRTAVYAEHTFHAAYEPARAVRTKDYKLIRSYSNVGHRVPANVDDSPSKNIAAERGFFSEAVPTVTLFDLRADPMEKINLADDTRYRSVREHLEEVLSQWMAQTNDPMMGGYVAAPEGAIVDPEDAWSPG